MDGPNDASSSDHLTHFGVKGMRWGFHRSDGRRVELTNVAKTGFNAAKEYRAPNKTKATYAKKTSEVGGLHKVDDKQLQSMINRMEMERKYSTFMLEEAKRRKEGQKATLKFLGEVGKIALPIILGAMVGRAATSPGATKAYAYAGRTAINMSRKTIGM